MQHGRSDYQHIQDKTGRIPESEPVFLLRAQDANAATAIRFWADAHDKAGGDPRCSEQARIIANNFDRWPKKKVADYPGPIPTIAAAPVGITSATPTEGGVQATASELPGERKTVPIPAGSLNEGASQS